MTDPDLKSLEDRLKKARAPKKGQISDEEADKAASYTGMAWRMGMELVTGVVVGVFLGMYIDDWLGTKPIAMITLVLLGFAAGIRNVIVGANRMQEHANRDDETKDS